MDRMRELVDLLNKYAYKYYVLDEPVIADAEYDKLYDELLDLEAKEGRVLDDSPTKRVGGELLKEFTPYKHRHKLYSLDKCQSMESFRNWENRVVKSVGKMPMCSVEYKFDGLTINLTYENGKLVKGATRGDGVTGEDVTEQVKTIKSVPLSIPFKGVCEVQGEGIMRLSALAEYNKKAKEPLKNARNGVAGAIRNLDPKVTAKRNLDVICYSVGYIEGREFGTQQEMLGFLKENKFKVSDYTAYCDNESDIELRLKEIEERRDSLDFLIDGAVIKICETSIRDELGYTEKFPRWAIAYKYKAEEATTTVKDVIWQVSRTGKLNPLAIVEPVELSGATVSRATLNNYDDIKRKDIKIGSRVFIRRSNDVIPEITGVAEHTAESREIEIPDKCPYCGGEVVRSGAFVKCANVDDCAPAIVSAISHYCSKDAMDIEGLSDKTAELLYNAGHFRTIADIYKLTAADLEGLEGFKEKKTDNLLKAIERSKTRSLDRFVYALGVPNIGKKSARVLTDAFPSIEALKSAEVEDMTKLDDFGEIMARGVYDYFRDEKNISVIDEALALGVSPVSGERPVGGVFGGYKVVLTGSLESMKRSEAQRIVEENGGECSDTVSKSVNLVIAGKDAGSKLAKAQKLGIRIVDEKEFTDMVAGADKEGERP